MKKIVLLILIVLLPSFTFAMTVDTSGGTVTATTINTLTLSTLTLGATANYLVAQVASADGGSVDPTGVTWNGVAMTKLVSGNVDSRDVSIWGLANPATGNKSLVATFALNQNGGIALSAISFIGAAGTGVTAYTVYSGSVGASINTETIGAGSYLVDVMHTPFAGPVTVGTGQTQFANQSGSSEITTSSYKLIPGQPSTSRVTISSAFVTISSAFMSFFQKLQNMFWTWSGLHTYDYAVVEVVSQ